MPREYICHLYLDVAIQVFSDASVILARASKLTICLVSFEVFCCSQWSILKCLAPRHWTQVWKQVVMTWDTSENLSAVYFARPEADGMRSGCMHICLSSVFQVSPCFHLSYGVFHMDAHVTKSLSVNRFVNLTKAHT